MSRANYNPVLTFLTDSGSTLIGCDWFAEHSEHITLETAAVDQLREQATAALYCEDAS